MIENVSWIVCVWWATYEMNLVMTIDTYEQDRTHFGNGSKPNEPLGRLFHTIEYEIGRCLRYNN
jgi:hypothetical protein